MSHQFAGGIFFDALPNPDDILRTVQFAVHVGAIVSAFIGFARDDATA
jgi:hypothetical protein